MAVELRRVAVDGSFDAILPDWSDLVFSQDFDPGALSFTYAMTGRNANLLTHGAELVCLLDGIEPADARFYLTQADGANLPETDSSASRAYNLLSLRNRFNNLMVAPSTSSTVADQFAFDWTNKTPGQMVIDAIDNAMARAGGLITPSGPITVAHPVSWLNNAMGFSPTTDSAGVAWPLYLDKTVDPGSSVADLLKWLSDNGFAYPRMQGHTLNLYANLGTDRTTGSNPVVLASGKDLLDASYQTDSSDLVNVLMVQGESTTSSTGSPVIVWVHDDASIAQYGYREGQIQVTGLSTPLMLTRAGNAYLNLRKQVRYSYTYSQSASYLEQSTAASGTFRPFVDYAVGDTILFLDGNQFAADRVRLLSASWPSATTASVALTVNDFFADRSVELDIRVGRLGG